MPAGRWRASVKQKHFRPGDAVVWVWGKNSNDPGRRVRAVVAYVASSTPENTRYAIVWGQFSIVGRRIVSGDSLEYDAIGGDL